MEMDLTEEKCNFREDILGFKPQKEIVYNKFLPYPELIDVESQRLLAEIKGNLGRAVFLKDVNPGCRIWTNRLEKYIKMFGLKFSKEDHVAFIHLFCELALIPDLKPFLTAKFLNMLIMLLKKKSLLSPEDLTIPWRPFYELYIRTFYDTKATKGLLHYFPCFESSINVFVNMARPYFGAVTQEMLDLWKPKLCPFDTNIMHETFTFLEIFLPIHRSAKSGGSNYELWFNDLMNLWKTCNNSSIYWEKEMMQLMAKLAFNNIGHIDWEPHLPFIFTKIVRSLNLPVYYKQVNAQARNSKLETSSMALWIVSVLGGNGSGQKYLDQMIKAVESYLQPANTGRWVIRLKELLRKLPFYFIQRLHWERFKVFTWEAPVPETHKLTEDDITKFVECLKPAMITAMFSRLEFNGNHVFIQHLSILRPELIIPPLIDILYSTLDSLTEPHKYTSAMISVTAIARSLATGDHYKEGPTHVIPLLFASLPGIDPNDVRKCFVTFQFITTFANMVPIIDCSAAGTYWKDLTPEEEVVCAATSQFEDFVLQFLDKCFIFIESSVLEITRLESDQDKRSKLENMSETALASTCFPLLYQMSLQIFNSALRKLYSFVTSHILETTVAGRYIASICRAFAKVRAEETLKMFIPHLCHNILNLTESSDVLKEEFLSNELLYNMLLLAQVADCKSGAIMQHKDLLESVLDRTLHMTSQEGNMYSSRLLNNIMTSISFTYPKEYRSSQENYDKPISEYLPVRDWGRKENVDNLKIEWIKPGKDEVTYAQHIVNKYLPVELEILQNNSLSLTREERMCRLNIVNAVMGCGSFLPIWSEPPLKLIDTRNELTNFTINVQKDATDVVMADGSNVRRAIATSISKLQKTLLKSAEGDTKALNAISLIWHGLLQNRYRSCESCDMHWKAFHIGKKMFRDKLSKDKKNLRSMLIERTLLQLELMETCNVILPTATHQEIILNLLELSTSRYTDVRTKAQIRLFTSLECFPASFRIITPKLLQILQSDSEVNHEQFKGALHVMLGPTNFTIVTRPDWNLLSELWPAIVKSKPSEKLSITRLLKFVSEIVLKQFPTIILKLKVPDSCDKAAEAFWKLSSPSPSLNQPSIEERKTAASYLEASNAENVDKYLSLLNSLNDAINNSNLTWRYQLLAICFIRVLVHPDVDYPPQIVKSILQLLVHDFILIRKVALKCILLVLKQQKRKFKKQLIDPKSVNQLLGYEMAEENAWLQYNVNAVPKTAEEWDTLRYINKTYVGYNGFPKELMGYSSPNEQPSLDREFHELTSVEQEVDAFFSNPSNIDRLMKFFCLEENKGKDKFNALRFLLFKNLFRNFGDKYIGIFLPHLNRLVVDKQETSQHCAAELLSGIIKGSKLWPFDKVKRMWDVILPLIRTGFNNMTVETVGDWGTFAATSSENRDPHRIYWFFELLMEDPLRQDSSFIDCGRLCALQGALNQEGWRVSQLYHRLLEYLQPHFSHPFQIIRERIGSVLVNVFASDLPSLNPKLTRGPYVSNFVEGILPQLAYLYNIPSTSIHVLHTNGPEPMTTSDIVTDVNTSIQQMTVESEIDEKDRAICLLKTVCKWMINSLMGAQYSALSEFFSLFPLIALMESYDPDEELKRSCTFALGSLAQSLVTQDIMPSALQSIKEVSESKSWWARETCLGFLQVFVFHNMAIFASQDSWIQQVNTLVLRLMKDERYEVREKAGQVLSGLLHIGFISNPTELLGDLKKLASRGKKKMTNENLTKIHAGVLGLCSFISASPYDVPDPIPEIFLLLGPHLSDPQPIPATIRKTLSDFKRTHHMNWEQHKLKFTEEQLGVLTDLNVPPSYIA